MQYWHSATTDRMIILKRRGHGDQVIGHGDDREQKDEQERERYEGAPRDLRVAAKGFARPQDDDEQRDGEP